MKIPCVTRSDMLDERLEITLHDNADIANAALRDIRKKHVYRAKTTGKWKCRYGAMSDKIAEERVSVACVDDCKRIVHDSPLLHRRVRFDRFA